MHHSTDKPAIQVPPSGDKGLLHEFNQYIKKENLFQQKDRLLIAVSGGVDSIVLCELCRQSGFSFALAHVNFQLRGKDSDADEAFVKALGDQYGIEVFIQRFETEKYAALNKLGIQVAARELRYQWFAEIINGSTTPGFSCLLTAHHANDNLETLLMNFFKGTGIAGMRGILPKQEFQSIRQLVRPLLFAQKKELVEFAELEKLTHCEDASNETNKYTRNYFRNELIPALQKVFPAVEENLLENIGRFNDVNTLYERSIAVEKKKLLVQKGNEIQLPVLKLVKTPALQTVLFEIIKDFNFSALQAGEVIKLLQAESGKYVQSSTHRILRNRAWLIISSLQERESQHYLIEEAGKSVKFKTGEIAVEKLTAPQNISIDPHIIMLDGTAVEFPLLLRKWKPGDYFYPLGMQKKKKLSRFFGDQKLSLFEKENSWVIESGKKIIWVVGRRIDDRFKVKPTSKYVLKLSLTPFSP